ncbi:MAG TPA: hypothetical protein VHG09_10620 [Longimicrobiales bacterium]|nr:hypothetical protein [Longimicrobiales bacterium]
MYRNCIFCSAEFGSNDALEDFPVGRRVAFDATKGRLWAICPVCARWNLSPIEERWEPVEAAEKLFVDARLRVQSENVGIAQLPDGTHLIRVGSAVPGELAAWRYGRQLIQRRKRYFIATGASAAAIAALYGGVLALSSGFFGIWMAGNWLDNRRKQKVIHRLPPAGDSGKGTVIRRWHLDGVNLSTQTLDRDLEVHVRDAHQEKPGAWDGKVRRHSHDTLVLTGHDAHAFLSRAMVFVNRKGATEEKLRDANQVLSKVGSAEEVLRQAASNGTAFGSRAGHKPHVIGPTDALVLEMALNEESERRAMEGELATLEAAWREAEEIAAIADSLPGEAAVNRLIDRLAR